MIIERLGLLAPDANPPIHANSAAPRTDFQRPVQLALANRLLHQFQRAHNLVVRCHVDRRLAVLQRKGPVAISERDVGLPGLVFPDPRPEPDRHVPMNFLTRFGIIDPLDLSRFRAAPRGGVSEVVEI